MIHKKNIFHTDIKLENIMAGGKMDNDFVIIDFLSAMEGKY